VNDMAKAKKKANKKKGGQKKATKKTSASSGLSHWERMDDPLMYAGEAIIKGSSIRSQCESPELADVFLVAFFWPPFFLFAFFFAFAMSFTASAYF